MRECLQLLHQNQLIVDIITYNYANMLYKLVRKGVCQRITVDVPRD